MRSEFAAGGTVHYKTSAGGSLFAKAESTKYLVDSAKKLLEKWKSHLRNPWYLFDRFLLGGDSLLTACLACVPVAE